MDRKKLFLFAGIALLLLLVVGQTLLIAGGSSSSGYSFNMVMKAGDRDPVTFAGIAMGNSLKLSGDTGGIATVTLLADDDLYILTPSVKTARKVENPAPPALTDSGWVEWLVEPGRINPLNFASQIGVEDDFTGEIDAGERGNVLFVFEDGILKKVEFPGSRDSGTIKYEYSNVELDSSIKVSDLSIPGDFLVID